MSVQSASPRSTCAADAIILIGATCGGAEAYAEVAEELGYGPLAMPTCCDANTIFNQLAESRAMRLDFTGS